MTTMNSNERDDDERLWEALKYRIQAARNSRSRVRRQDHLDQATLYLNALNPESDAATRMREACAEKARVMGREWKALGDKSHGKDETYYYAKADACDDVQAQLQSLTLAAVEKGEKEDGP